MASPSLEACKNRPKHYMDKRTGHYYFYSGKSHHGALKVGRRSSHYQWSHLVKTISDKLELNNVKLIKKIFSFRSSSHFSMVLLKLIFSLFSVFIPTIN